MWKLFNEWTIRDAQNHPKFYLFFIKKYSFTYYSQGGIRGIGTNLEEFAILKKIIHGFLKGCKNFQGFDKISWKVHSYTPDLKNV